MKIRLSLKAEFDAAAVAGEIVRIVESSMGRPCSMRVVEEHSGLPKIQAMPDVNPTAQTYL
jgi:hypothetical protein